MRLPDSSVTSLTRQRTAQKRDRLKAGSNWTDFGLVFTTTIGTPLDERNVRREFDSILTAARLPEMRINDLRHTCASFRCGHPRPRDPIRCDGPGFRGSSADSRAVPARRSRPSR